MPPVLCKLLKPPAEPMDYKELKMDFLPGEDAAQTEEILVAELAALGFESFYAENGSLSAFIPASAQPGMPELESVCAGRAENLRWEHHEHQNWNAVWEQSFEPVELGRDVYVYARFHERRPGFRHYIAITPKMSFGTGHHATTRLVMQLLLETDLQGKSLLDLGTGTGILAILAHQLGATGIAGTEIEPWALENAEENFIHNGLTRFTLFDAALQSSDYGLYDVVIANINRNIILHMKDVIDDSLKPGGTLILSGFYQSDIPLLQEAFQKLNIELQRSLSEKDWCALLLTKHT